MNKTFLISSEQNPSLGCAITTTEADYEKAVEISKESFLLWFGLNYEDFEKAKYFGPEDFSFFLTSCFSEPIENCFRENEIEFSMSFPLDEDGELVKGFDKVISDSF